jgi:hypothetical protein
MGIDVDGDRRLSRPLAAAYVVMVTALWSSHVVGLVVVLTTGPSSTRSDDPWTGGLVLGLIAACFLVLAQVSRQLEPGTNLLMHPFRMLTLFYGSELPVAWRSLRV